MIEVSRHAVERFRERIFTLSKDEIEELLVKSIQRYKFQTFLIKRRNKENYFIPAKLDDIKFYICVKDPSRQVVLSVITKEQFDVSVTKWGYEYV